jgi:hypothetical protein
LIGTVGFQLTPEAQFLRPSYTTTPLLHSKFVGRRLMFLMAVYLSNAFLLIVASRSQKHSRTIRRCAFFVRLKGLRNISLTTLAVQPYTRASASTKYCPCALGGRRYTGAGASYAAREPFPSMACVHAANMVARILHAQVAITNI